MSRPILVDFKTGKKIKSISLDYEKDIQKFVENNMEEILNIRFLKSEVSFDDIELNRGRIDTVGIDENNCPVIIEYKLNERSSILEQALFYLRWLKSHKESFYMMVLKKYGEKACDLIEWKPRIILIANKFNKYSIPSIRDLNVDITLIQYYVYNDNIIAFEFLNNFHDSRLNMNSSQDESINENEKNNSNNKEYYSEFLLMYNKLNQDMKALVDYISFEIENISNDVSTNVLKWYKVFIKTKNFVSMVITKNKVHLYLPLEYTSDMEQFKYISDVTNVGHWGTGDLRITITSKKEFEDIFKYIEKSFQEN